MSDFVALAIFEIGERTFFVMLNILIYHDNDAMNCSKVVVCLTIVKALESSECACQSGPVAFYS